MFDVNFEYVKRDSFDFHFEHDKKEGFDSSFVLNTYPQKTSELINDLNFADINYVDTAVGKIIIPSKLSELDNDVGYITLEEVPKVDTSDLVTKQELNNVSDSIPTKTSQLTNDSGFLTQHQDISNLVTKDELNKKQDIINDLSTIRSGAELGATAVQPSTLNNYVTSKELDEGLATKQPIGDYALKSEIPKNMSNLNNDVGYITLADIPEVDTSDFATKEELNKKQDIINDLEEIRSGASKGVTSVQPNDLSLVAKTGDYNDLFNKPNIPIKYGYSIVMSVDPTTYIGTLTLKDQNGNTLGDVQTFDLPLESVVVGGSYDEVNKSVILTLKGGDTVSFSVADLVRGLQTEITDNNKLSTNLVDDTNSSKKFVSESEKALWNDKQDKISDLDAIRSGASKGETAVQPDQLSAVATSGNYADLNGKPTIPTKTSEITNDSGFITASALVGYATQDWVQGLGYITGINSADVTMALGYTPLKQADLSTYAKKSEIPTQTSQLTNNSDFTTKSYVDGLVGDIETALNNINSGG